MKVNEGLTPNSQWIREPILVNTYLLWRACAILWWVYLGLLLTKCSQHWPRCSQPSLQQLRWEKEDGKTPVLSLGWVELPPINITGKTDLRNFYLILLTTKTKKLKMFSVTFLPCLFPGSTVLHPQLLYLLYFEQAGAVGWVLGWYYLANFALNFQGYVF